MRIFKITTSKNRLLYQNSEKCWQKKQEGKHLASKHPFPQIVCTTETMSIKRMEENFINISTPCEGVEAVVRQCTCVKDLQIKTPAQVPEYSYLLPTCHSPDLLTSPCRCSSPRLCHTCSGTPETLHTDTHEATQ